jgi:hypothetical protein
VGGLEEIRVAVVGNEIPTCWRKLRDNLPLPQRTQLGPLRSLPLPAGHVLTVDEQNLIVTLCQTLGLDFAELDTGRDLADGRLYVFDANSTPYFTTVESSTPDERELALELLSATFARQFQPQITFAGAPAPT